MGTYIAPPSTIVNGGYAQCASLTNGSKVRVKLTCPFFGTTKIVYGPWVSTANTKSKANCGSVHPDLVDDQIGWLDTTR